MLLCPWEKKKHPCESNGEKVTYKWECISNDTFIFNSVSKIMVLNTHFWQRLYKRIKFSFFY